MPEPRWKVIRQVPRPCIAPLSPKRLLWDAERVLKVSITRHRAPVSPVKRAMEAFERTRLLKLVHELAQTQERESQLSLSLQKLQIEKSHVTNALEILRDEKVGVEEGKQRLEMELKKAQTQIKEFQKEMDELRHQIALRQEISTHSVGVEVSLDYIHPASPSPPPQKMNEKKPSRGPTRPDVPSPAKTLNKSMDVGPISLLEKDSHTSSLSDHQDPRSEADETSLGQDIQSLLKEIIHAQNQDGRSHSEELRRFLEASRKSAINISLLLDSENQAPPQRPKVSKAKKPLKTDSSRACKSCSHHNVPSLDGEDPTSLSIDLTDSSSAPKPVEHVQKHAQIQTDSFSETVKRDRGADRVRSPIQTKSFQLPSFKTSPKNRKIFEEREVTQCTCRTVLSFCPLCSGVHQSMNQLDGPPKSLKKTPSAPVVAIKSSSGSLNHGSSDESFLLQNETSMLTSLHDLVVDLEQDLPFSDSSSPPEDIQSLIATLNCL